VLGALRGTPAEARITATLKNRGDYVDRMMGLHPLNQQVWWQLLRARDLPEEATRHLVSLKWWCGIFIVAFLCAVGSTFAGGT
jgi:hypothetical protein